MLTALRVITDRQEYSRFEPSRSTVKVRVLPDPVNPGVAATVDFCRFSGHVLSTKEVDFSTGDFPKGLVVTFDLNAIVDSDGFVTATSGEFYVVAKAGDIASPAAPLTLSVITADEMRKNYCKGLPLKASEVLAPKKQPQTVTGVTIKSVSDTTAPGYYPLVYTVGTPNTLTWGNGVAIEITDTTTSEILPSQYGDYIEVDIDPFELPAASASESILIDQDTIDDETIQSHIRMAVSEYENRVLRVKIEPRRVATEPFFSNPGADEYFDEFAAAVPFYRREVFTTQAKAWHVSLPYQQLQKVPKMVGFFGDTQNFDISGGVFKTNVKQGTVDVLPQNANYSYILTFFSQMDLWGIREYISDFWRYKAIVGLRDTEADIIKAIGYEAAIPILAIAGQALRGGRTNESISKDGVSRTAGYTKAVYSATIDEIKDWLKANRPRLSSRYRGITTVIL